MCDAWDAILQVRHFEARGAGAEEAVRGGERLAAPIEAEGCKIFRASRRVYYGVTVFLRSKKQKKIKYIN